MAKEKAPRYPQTALLKQRALGFLKRQEWSVGNGQCPRCMGKAPWFFHGSTGFETKTPTGHKPNCSHAEIINFLRDKLESVD